MRHDAFFRAAAPVRAAKAWSDEAREAAAAARRLKGGHSPEAPPSDAAHKELDAYGWKHQGGGTYTHPQLRGHSVEVGPQGSGGTVRGPGGRAMSSISWNHREDPSHAGVRGTGVQDLGYHLMRTNQRQSIGTHDDGYTGRDLRQGGYPRGREGDPRESDRFRPL